MTIDILITKLTMLIEAQSETEYRLGLKTALRLANEAKLSASQNASNHSSELPISNVVNCHFFLDNKLL